MFRIFRNIRNQFLTANKFSRYLAYAIGEVLLVVLGILIALQINNWNEERKAKVLERKMLRDVRESLQGTVWQLNMAIECNSNGAASAELIVDHLKSDLPYDSSLDGHFSKAIEYCVPNIRNAGYESLKAFGIHRVTNESIRSALDVFNFSWIEDLGNRQEFYFFSTVSPTLTELFDTVAMRSEMKPFDYEELKQSKEYLSILNTSIAYRKDQVHWYEIWLQGQKDLEAMIAEELGEE